MSSYKQLTEQRNVLIEKARDLLAGPRKEGRVWSADEHAQYDKMKGDIDRLETERTDAYDYETASSALNDQRDQRADQKQVAVVDKQAGAAKPDSHRAEPPRGDATTALRSWLSRDFSRESRENARNCGVELLSSTLTCGLWGNRCKSISQAEARLNEIRSRDSRESRADMTIGTYQTPHATGGAAGGFLVPEALMASIDKALLQFGAVRNECTLITTAGGNPLPIPTVNDTANEGEVIAENAAANAQEPTIGEVRLGAWKYSSKMVVVSLELLQDSGIDIASMLGELLGERLARIENRHATVGTGSSQIRGINAASSGSAAGVTTASFAAGVTYANLVDMKHSVDAAYRASPKCTWMMHDTFLQYITKIVDGSSRPLLLPGTSTIKEGSTDVLLGHRIAINNHVATYAASSKVAIFGDLSKYYLREGMDLTLVRLDERYAEKAQVAFLAWMRADGGIVNVAANPIKHLATGA